VSAEIYADQLLRCQCVCSLDHTRFGEQFFSEKFRFPRHVDVYVRVKMGTKDVTINDATCASRYSSAGEKVGIFE
jgi:hypothetical protein